MTHKLIVVSEYVPAKSNFTHDPIWERGRYREARAFLCQECGKIFTIDVKFYKESGKIYDFGQCEDASFSLLNESNKVPAGKKEDKIISPYKGTEFVRHIAKCKNCNTTIESERSTDWVSCKCFTNTENNMGIFIDGGPEWPRAGGNFENFEDKSIYKSDEQNELEVKIPTKKIDRKKDK